MPRTRKIQNNCIDHSELLNSCNITKLLCEYPECDNYSETPRNRKPKRDFVHEVAAELEKLGVDFEWEKKFTEPKHNEVPPDF